MGQKKNIRSVDEVKKLISIQSITGNEKELALYLDNRFKSIGCRTALHEAAQGRYNVTAIIDAGDSDKLGLLFHGHLDTVPAYNMVNPFSPKETDGFINGRGSVDQKGGLAAVITAFEAFVASDKKLRKSVGFVMNEERSFYWRLTGIENIKFYGALDNLSGKNLDKKINEERRAYLEEAR